MKLQRKINVSRDWPCRFNYIIRTVMCNLLGTIRNEFKEEWTILNLICSHLKSELGLEGKFSNQ